MARRRDLNLILPGVQAVIVTTLPYWPGGKTGFARAHSSPSNARISSYAWGVDYHDELANRQKELMRWLHAHYGGDHVWYADTGALMERSHYTNFAHPISIVVSLFVPIVRKICVVHISDILLCDF